MEPFSLAGILIAIGSGALAKAGEDSFDALKGLVQYRLSGTATAKALAAGDDLDPKQVTLDVATIEDDPEVEKLKEQIKAAVQQNKDLEQKFLAAQQQYTPTNSQVNRDQVTGFQTNVFKDGIAYIAKTINITQSGH